MKRLWLDDMRPAPEGYTWVKDYNEAVRYWQTEGTPDIASLDHDLYGMTMYVPGTYDYSGFDFVQWLCGDNPASEDSGRWPFLSLALHTDYTGGRERMADLIERYGPYDNRETYEKTYPINEAGYSGYYWGSGLVHVYGYIYTKDEDGS